MLIPLREQEELRSRYNPEGSTLRNLQLRLVEMLKYIDQICQKEDIPYWLAGGNALGLARHGGFIPWDDDLDIEMRREDFFRLRAAVLNDPNSPYKWQDATTDKYYLMHYAKLRDTKSEVIEAKTDFYKMKGIFIDIFPIDYSTHFMTKYSTLTRRLVEGVVWHAIPKKFRKYGIITAKVLLLKCVWPTWSFLNKPFKSKKYLYHYPTSIAKVFHPFDLNHIFPLKRANFEGVEINIPGNIEAYLEDAYGNWKQLPPLNKIHIHFDSSNIIFFD